MRERTTTSRLLTMIRNASSFREATACHDYSKEPRLQDYLYELMTKKNCTAKDVIQRTGIERSYYYHILSGNRKPGRNMVIRIGLCLCITLQEMNQLLRMAGYAELYVKKQWDAAVVFAVTHQYTMEQTNELLQESGLEPLYWEN